jgi:hypothetical protein
LTIEELKKEIEKSNMDAEAKAALLAILAKIQELIE